MKNPVVVGMFAALLAGCAGEEHRAEPARMPVPRGGGSIGVPWESQFVTKSAVRFRDEVTVAAQLGWDENGQVSGASLDAQARQAYANVAKALETGGATSQDVVEETIYVNDMAAAIAALPAVRRSVYGENPTVATTIVEVKRLSDVKAQIAVKVVAKLDIPVPRTGSREGSSGGGGGGRRGGRRGMGGGYGGGP
jgi:enamine deaminase RidA (YjgF/YER057c/UK114 family)